MKLPVLIVWPDILFQEYNTFPYVTIFLLRQIVVQSVGTKAKKTIVDHMINPKVGVHLYFYKSFQGYTTQYTLS